MESWIGLSLLGVLIQSGRTVLQKNLAGRLSVGGATYSRFLYGSPLAWLMVAGMLVTTGHSLPQPGPAFFLYVTLGGLAQILGNAIFIHLVRANNFTVITTYIKTETVISALFSFVLLNDTLSLTGFAGVLITFLGVMVLAAGKGVLTPGALRNSFLSREMLYGLGVGALYAVGSTSYRGAILGLQADDQTLASILTLAWVSLIQALIMGVWLRVYQPAVLQDTLRSWRYAIWIGVTGAFASAAWYIAFSQQVTAYVLALGQVELVITYLYSRFLFKERTTAGEFAGICATLAGILMVVLAR